MTTSTTIPASEITQALDLLIDAGVLSGHDADYHLAEFLQEIDMPLEDFIEASY